jgi:hypothetical protein
VVDCLWKLNTSTKHLTTSKNYTTTTTNSNRSKLGSLNACTRMFMPQGLSYHLNVLEGSVMYK